MEKPRRRQNKNVSKKADPSSIKQETSDDSIVRRTSPDVSKSEELEYLEVKHVVIILVMVFTLFFIGTFLYLNAINSRTMGKRRHFPSATESSLTDDYDNENVGQQFQVDDDAKRGGTKSRGGKALNHADLELPTILWWTDMLYPHSLSGKPVSQIKCDVGTCLSTREKGYLQAPNVRGIMFYGTDFRAYEAPLPREKWHEWALLHEESPMNNYILSSPFAMRLFNHTSTFRRESHFPITTNSLPSLAYLTERQPVPLTVKNNLRKGAMAPIAYIQSHCDVASDRDRYVEELMRYVDIDSYGSCLNNKKLPPHLQDPVQSMHSGEFYDFISKYKFHLAFENAICEDYITEKFFRPFHLGSVPIHMGSATAKDWAPSDPSIILVDDFESPRHLAEFIQALDEDDAAYERYLHFKKTGVQNMLLLETMRSREWGINEYGRHSFITAFECHVCDRIYERWNLERRKEAGDTSVELPEPRMGSSKHMSCPVPFVSVGELEDTKLDDDIHTWIQDYWSMHDQAVALDRMIREGYSDTGKLFDVLQNMYRERSRV